jgi:DNA-binding beta-propeller fold protein YncE
MKRTLYLLTGIVVIALFGLGVLSKQVKKKFTVEAAGIEAPIFEVDPWWPRQLPNHWITGATIGLSIDANDNVWTLHRPQTIEDTFKAVDMKVGLCCKVAPPVLEYNQAGELIGSWGGPGAGYDWPDFNHGITVDHKGNVWLAGAGPQDTQILKFSSAGKFLMQLGKHGVHNGSNDEENFWEPTKVFEDPDTTTNEIYVSDGYENRRVIVFDEDTGKFKRLWGAYGKKPDDVKVTPYDPTATPSKNFSTVHCVIVSKDGFVYVCDRANDRIQVFRRDGTFVKEVFIETQTRRSGSVWDMAFSSDPQQTYIYALNGVNEHVNVLLRSSLEVLTSFGDGGRHPGEFFGCHNIATDSKGNIYITETYSGARIQRFIYKGVGPVARDQGVPWPKDKR